jgi:hypothetical protein
VADATGGAGPSTERTDCALALLGALAALSRTDASADPVGLHLIGHLDERASCVVRRE